MQRSHCIKKIRYIYPVLPTYEVFSFDLHNNYDKYAYETEHAHIYTSCNHTLLAKKEKKRKKEESYAFNTGINI
jgi:hypothetical protein